MKQIYLLLAAALLLSSCNEKAPDCSHKDTVENLQEIIFEQVSKFENPVLSKNDTPELKREDFNQYAKMYDFRPTGYEKEINKYSCVVDFDFAILDADQFKEALLNLKVAGVAFGGGQGAWANAIEQNFITADHKLHLSVAYSSQMLKDKSQYVEVALRQADLAGLQLGLYFNDKSKGKSSTDIPQIVGSEKENVVSEYKLDGQALNIINDTITDFNKVYSNEGVSGVSKLRDDCYRFDGANKENYIQCIAFDATSVQVIPAVEKNQGYPMSEGFTFQDLQKRARQKLGSAIKEESDQDTLINWIGQEVQRNLQKRLSTGEH